MSIVPAPTSGIGVVTAVKVDAAELNFSLSGSHTHQITANAVDVAGTNHAATLSYSSKHPSRATVSGTGLITGIAKGHATIEVSAAAFGNSRSAINSPGNPMHGLAAEKVYKEIHVFITA